MTVTKDTQTLTHNLGARFQSFLQSILWKQNKTDECAIVVHFFKFIKFNDKIKIQKTNKALWLIHTYYVFCLMKRQCSLPILLC